MSNRAIRFAFMVNVAIAMIPGALIAQTEARPGWIEEKDAKVEGINGRSYLDVSSIHRGEDGLVYFNESTGVTRSQEIGEKGFMKDAYDCSRDVKYMCIGAGDWRNDLKSTVHTAGDPALPIYRHYLCGDPPAADPKSKAGDREPP